jgi:hypothetical protein
MNFSSRRPTRKHTQSGKALRRFYYAERIRECAAAIASALRFHSFSEIFTVMLWAVTSFFNPLNYKSRLTTYRTFKEHLRVPLIAVELSYGGSFELRGDDADIVVQLVGRDVLWQKERLLNLALRSLPPECDAVAWLDADVIFASDDWPARAQAALERFRIIQLFSERCNLAQGATRSGADWSPLELTAPSVGYTIATGKLEPGILGVAGSYVTGGPTNGLAWAARRSLLDRHGLYDAHVLGQGDRAIVCAAVAKFDDWVLAAAANRRQEQHYRAWAEPFFADVAKGIGFIDGRIFHLWHGDAKARTLRTPHYRDFGKFSFDPFNDIAVDANGCWRWNSVKPEMHRYVADFFAFRKEDG